MVVKSKRGRRRYIAFRVRGERMTDEVLLSTLHSSLSPIGVRYKMIQFDGLAGIVRVGGSDQGKAVTALNAQGEGRLETLKASGTLRSLREGRGRPQKE